MPLDFSRSTADWLACQCGNEPHLDGFYACLRDGTCVEPTVELWKENLYVCVRCCAVYDVDLMEQVAIATDGARRTFAQ